MVGADDEREIGPDCWSDKHDGIVLPLPGVVLRQQRMASCINKVAALLLVAAGVCTACNNGNAVAVLPGDVVYTGQWSGSSSFNTRVSFSVSNEQTITAISFEYAFGGCSGTIEASNLSLPIEAPRMLLSAAPTSALPQFVYATGDAKGGLAEITGTFSSDRSVSGAIVFAEYQNCGSGNAVAVWNATKQ